MTTTQTANLPLTGITVLDLAQVIAGPETAMLLGELGADVIKVEKPGGEDSRQLGFSMNEQGISKSFAVLNRNKRSIVLDLSKPEGKEVLYRMIPQVDVLIQGFIPGTAERMGIGYDLLSKINPRLVYVALSGFGAKGPYAKRPAYDIILQGLSGVMAVRRDADGAPIPAPIWVGDASGPFILGFATLAALMAREQTGRGQKLESSLLQAQVAMQATQLIKLEGEESVVQPGQSTNAPHKCSDGEYINISILNERQWKGFCKALDVEYLADHPDFNSVRKRGEKREELFGLVDGLLALKPSMHWVDALKDVGVPCGPVITRDQVFFEPQILENDMFVTVDQPGLGVLQEMRFPVTFSDMKPGVHRPAPAVGEHSREVLTRFGFTDQEVEALFSTVVVA